MEPTDGMFSSPEKPPPKRNGIPHNSWNTEEEMIDLDSKSMPRHMNKGDPDVVTGTTPEPLELLVSQQGNRRTYLPPPRSKSPIKTHLNSSPVRPPSSPSRPIQETPSRPELKPPANRRLDFSMGKPRLSTDRSTTKGISPALARGRPPPKAGRGKKRAFDLSHLSDEDDDESTILTNGADMTNGVTHDESAMLPNGDTSLHLPTINIAERLGDDEDDGSLQLPIDDTGEGLGDDGDIGDAPQNVNDATAGMEELEVAQSTPSTGKGRGVGEVDEGLLALSPQRKKLKNLSPQPNNVDESLLALSLQQKKLKYLSPHPKNVVGRQRN